MLGSQILYLCRGSCGEGCSQVRGLECRSASLRFLVRKRRGFLAEVVAVFDQHSGEIGTTQGKKGLTSDQALAVLRSDLVALGFGVESGKRTEDKIRRPVFFGENAQPDLQYEVDAWHPEWRAGLEVEAGRAWMGNAVYRDLVQALVMVEMDHLLLGIL